MSAGKPAKPVGLSRAHRRPGMPEARSVLRFRQQRRGRPRPATGRSRRRAWCARRRQRSSPTRAGVPRSQPNYVLNITCWLRYNVGGSTPTANPSGGNWTLCPTIDSVEDNTGDGRLLRGCPLSEQWPQSFVTTSHFDTTGDRRIRPIPGCPRWWSCLR